MIFSMVMLIGLMILTILIAIFGLLVEKRLARLEDRTQKIVLLLSDI